MLVSRTKVVALPPGQTRRISAAEILQKAAARRSKPVTADSAANRATAAAEARREIDEQLKLISTAEHAIDDAQADIASAYRVIEEKLRAHNLTSHSNGSHFAELVEQFSRQSRTLDPKKFRAAVANDVFWDCVSVNIGKAEQHLSEKEILKISDVVPAKLMGIILKIKKLEPRKRSKK